MHEFTALRLEINQHVAIVTLARPQLNNRMDFDAHAELEAALHEAASTSDVRAIVVAAQGKHFCAGGDFDEMRRLREDTDRRRRMFEHGRSLIQRILSLEVPLIMAVQGDAVGLGASVALLGDIVVAAPDSGFRDPHVAIGLVAGDGGCIAWPLSAGLLRAKRYLLTGDRIDGQQAYTFGLVTDLVAGRDAIHPCAVELAQRIAALPPLAVRGTKKALNRYAVREQGDSFELSIVLEEQTMTSQDVGEAIDAISARRPPVFQGC